MRSRATRQCRARRAAHAKLGDRDCCQVRRRQSSEPQLNWHRKTSRRRIHGRRFSVARRLSTTFNGFFLSATALLVFRFFVGQQHCLLHICIGKLKPLPPCGNFAVGICVTGLRAQRVKIVAGAKARMRQRAKRLALLTMRKARLGQPKLLDQRIQPSRYGKSFALQVQYIIHRFVHRLQRPHPFGLKRAPTLDHRPPK